MSQNSTTYKSLRSDNSRINKDSSVLNSINSLEHKIIYKGGVFFKKCGNEKPQEKMFSYGEKHNMNIFIRREILFNDTISRYYGVFQDFEKIKNILLNSINKKKYVSLHEIVRDTDKCKLFFDLDFKNETFEKDISLELVNKFQYYLNNFIKDSKMFKYINMHPLNGNFDIIYLDIITSNKIINNKHKISLHLLCNQIIFKNIYEQKKFILLFCHYLYTHNPEILKHIDVQLYRKNFSLRTIYSCKPDEERLCLPFSNPHIVEEIGDYEHDIELYFIKEIYYDNLFDSDKLYRNIMSSDKIALKDSPFILKIHNMFITKEEIPKKNKVFIDTNNYSPLQILEYKDDPTFDVLNIPLKTDNIDKKIHYLLNLLNKIYQNNKKFFNEDQNYYKRKLSLTFCVANYLEKDEKGMYEYLEWLKRTRESLGQIFDKSMKKYKQSYMCYDLHRKNNFNLYKILQYANILV